MAASFVRLDNQLQKAIEVSQANAELEWYLTAGIEVFTSHLLF
jgi:hypothetical protein